MSEKIEACACGEQLPLCNDLSMKGERSKIYGVNCYACGWHGPRHNTREAAISAWNEVMRAVRMMKRLREPIGKPKDSGAGQGDSSNVPH